MQVSRINRYVRFIHLSIDFVRSRGHEFDGIAREVHSVDDAVSQANFIRVKSFPSSV